MQQHISHREIIYYDRSPHDASLGNEYHKMLKQAPIIDCRKHEDYVQSHIQNACSLPAEQLFARMHELPKRQQAVILCGDKAALKTASDFLQQRGYQVSEKIVWTADFTHSLQQQGQLESGIRSRQLWQAAPLFRRFVETIMPEHNIQAGKGLDIACGAGRDMVYLATQGWQMTGVDRSLDSLQRVATLSDYHKLNVQTVQRDLETGNDPLSDFSAASFDLICVARYLHRPLFPSIKRLLKPRGIILYQTFMQGCEKTAIGRPRNPNFLLKVGELANIFSEADILYDELEHLEDGRPVAAFVARMP